MKKETTTQTSDPTLVKVVNHGKNGIYLYSAIVKIGDKYFWTKSKLLKNKTDKHSFDFLSLEVSIPLNDWSMKNYINK